ncbi:hypothetical protein ACWGI1_03620 [Streptomyces sp. NPDC054835]
MSIGIERGSVPLVLRGRFKPWSIDTGHSKVLLRGFLGEYESEDPPRIFDVLFQNVSRISVGVLYNDLHVTVAENGETRLEERRVGGKWHDAKMFLLNAESGCDYIVAGVLFWAEVTVSAIDPSPLMEDSPAPGSIRGKVFRI